MKTLLLSTTGLWNCGDDFIRKGLLDLMRLHPYTRILWWNRGDGIRNAFVNKLSINARLADYVCIAGTPGWIARTERLYRYCLQYRIPLSIIGVGTKGGISTNYPKKLMKKVARSGLVEVCMARDKIALNLMRELGFKDPELILDPAFFMNTIPGERVNNILCWRDISRVYNTFWTKKTPWRIIAETVYSNWKTRPKVYNQFMKDIFSRLPEPKLVVVHDNREIKKAEKLFGADNVFYSVDYMDMLKVYSTAKMYIGSRIHGAIPAAIHGAPVNLIYANKKATTIENCVELLRPHIAEVDQKIKVNYLSRKYLDPSTFIENVSAFDELPEALRKEGEKLRSKLKATTHLGTYLE